MPDSGSTAWLGPAGEAWDALADGLQSWADSIDWEAYVQDERRYLDWAYNALAEVTAHASELPDAELAALEADRRAHPDIPGKPKWWRARYHARQLVARRSVRVVAATKTNLAQLKALGIAAHDAGLAVVAQGLLRDPDMAEFLAGPWIRRGHPFPRPAHRPSWNDHPAAPQPPTTAPRHGTPRGARPAGAAPATVPPMTAEQLFGTLTVLQHDWEQGIWILRGHHRDRAAEQMLHTSHHAWLKSQRIVPGSAKVTWTLFTRHEPDCPETDPDEQWCGCLHDGELDYLDRPATRLTRGAQPVTWVYVYDADDAFRPDLGQPEEAAEHVAHLRSNGWFDDAYPPPSPPGQQALFNAPESADPTLASAAATRTLLASTPTHAGGPA